MENAISAHDVNARPAGRIAKLVYYVLAGFLAAGVLAAASQYGRNRAYEALRMRAQGNAELNAVLLRTVLEKQRSLPFVLAQDRDVISALSSRSESMFRLINGKLENLVPGTRASVIYLLDAGGLAVA